MAKKYYWLKLQRDFFKRHDIRIIEGMPNGKDYLLFYLKLLCESIDHEGNLRFSDQIPYNEDMLATITNTKVDIVRTAIKVFTQLNMMDVMDDGTYYMSEVEKMMGSETVWAEKKREYREKLGQCPQSVHPLSDKSKSIEKDKEKDNIYNEHFQEFWSAYPRKVDKKKAYKCYQTRLKEGFSEEELMQAAQNYADECKKENRDSKYIKHPSTFLGVDTPFTEYLKKGNENGEKNKATTGRQYTDEELDRFEQLL